MKGSANKLPCSYVMLTILLLCLVAQVTGLGQVEVVFKSMSSPESKLADGTSCKDNICTVKMKVRFTAPVEQYFKSQSLTLDRDLILPQTGEGALNNGGATKFDNPLNITAPGQKKLTEFALIVTLEDTSYNYRKPIATLELRVNVTTGRAYDRNLTDQDTNFTLNLAFRVICEADYYYDCSVHCTAQDTNLGHYNCHPVTGDKVCLPGWTGEDCLTRTCTSELSIRGGTVTSPPQDLYKEQDTITVECDEDYQLNPHLDSNVLTCEEDGEWSFPDLATLCTKSACEGCDSLGKPLHGTLVYSSYNTCNKPATGARVTVRCDPEHVAVGPVGGLWCGDNGRWEGGESEGGRRILDCVPTDDEKDEQDKIISQIGNNALIIAAISFLAFLTVLSVYCFIHRRERNRRKMRVFPNEGMFEEKKKRGGRKGKIESSGIGHVEDGKIAPPAYDNKGFVFDDYDYDF